MSERNTLAASEASPVVEDVGLGPTGYPGPCCCDLNCPALTVDMAATKENPLIFFDIAGLGAVGPLTCTKRCE